MNDHQTTSLALASDLVRQVDEARLRDLVREYERQVATLGGQQKGMEAIMTLTQVKPHPSLRGHSNLVPEEAEQMLADITSKHQRATEDLELLKAELQRRTNVPPYKR